MKAAYIKQIGSPSVIEFGEVPMPHIKDNELLVKISAVAASPVDTYIRAGKFPIKRLPLLYLLEVN